uniref:Uncharacterized protein n=1 Tax=Tetranychus urticae TaxID=32264 RepID=T1KQ39_TETUR
MIHDQCMKVDEVGRKNLALIVELRINRLFGLTNQCHLDAQPDCHHYQHRHLSYHYLKQKKKARKKENHQFLRLLSQRNVELIESATLSTLSSLLCSIWLLNVHLDLPDAMQFSVSDPACYVGHGSYNCYRNDYSLGTETSAITFTSASNFTISFELFQPEGSQRYNQNNER